MFYGGEKFKHVSYHLLFLFTVSLIGVIKSADIFVDRIVDIGRGLGISQIILGVTVAAAGTSLPEFGSALISVLTGNPDLGVGVVIGSNIWNIAGIIGISAILSCAVTTNRDEIRRDGLFGLLSILILTFFMLMGPVGPLTGVVLLALYGVYLWVLIKKQRGYYTSHLMDHGEVDAKTIISAILGFIGLVVFCRILVYSAVGIAEIMNVPEMIIGLFALAIGTSLAELVVAVNSAMKRMCSLSLGTVLGSNIFNILIGIGVPSLFVKIPVEPLSLILDAPVLMGVTVAVMYFMWTDMELRRVEGVALVAFYLAYAVLRITLTR
ncbi:calcium/sodium antiporter [Methanothermobacter thermautotrophicus]|uniref:calcium/sodium antiporter n=1 Tax=Methanothermobacter thermautotrophicus TaxID=145262 RepID=UPI003D7F29DB